VLVDDVADVGVIERSSIGETVSSVVACVVVVGDSVDALLDDGSLLLFVPTLPRLLLLMLPMLLCRSAVLTNLEIKLSTPTHRGPSTTPACREVNASACYLTTSNTKQVFHRAT
jgi:hypothetical protein